MKTIKLQSPITGKIKYIQREDGYPAEVGERINFKWDKQWIIIKVMETKPKGITNGRYIPDPEKFDLYREYVLENPGKKRTYEGYLAYKMKRMINQEKKGVKK